MSWVDDAIGKLRSSSKGTTKEQMKSAIAEAAHEFLALGYDWDDVEIVIIAILRPLAGELIILLHKWLREVINEEREAPVN